MSFICLFLFSQFPIADKNFVLSILKAITVLLFFFFLIPVLYIRIILKKKLKDYGWQFGNWRQGVFWGGFSLLASLAIAYIAIYQLKLPEKYISYFGFNFWLFLLYEIFLIGSYLALYEFFFRGFVMFSLEKNFKILSPLLQFLIFVTFYWLTDNVNWQSIFFLITAFFSGWITYRSRSQIYSLVYSWLFIIISDTAIIYLSKYIK
jgi:membrane protease YdiL (CAAX protease family)